MVLTSQQGLRSKESLHCLKECLTKERFAKLVQLSKTAVTCLYSSSGVELITHAGVAVLQSLILEQTELPAEPCFISSWLEL